MRRQSTPFRSLAALALAGVFAVAGTSARAESILFMAEEAGCLWCAMWDREIAPIYPKTTEGQAAPLQRFDIHGDEPDGITFLNRITYTPTFILVNKGKEVARIEGYPGEDFFWGLLGRMLKEAQIIDDTTG